MVKLSVHLSVLNFVSAPRAKSVERFSWNFGQVFILSRPYTQFRFEQCFTKVKVTEVDILKVTVCVWCITRQMQIKRKITLPSVLMELFPVAFFIHKIYINTMSLNIIKLFKGSSWKCTCYFNLVIGTTVTEWKPVWTTFQRIEEPARCWQENKCCVPMDNYSGRQNCFRME